jgi:hypothetical protein
LIIFRGFVKSILVEKIFLPKKYCLNIRQFKRKTFFQSECRDWVGENFDFGGERGVKKVQLPENILSGS